MALANVERDVLSLPEADRIYLLEVLWQSLWPKDSVNHMEKWMAEGERRLDEINAGTMPLVDSKQVFDDMRARLRP